MRGEVISSIELVLPENVVEAAYSLQRDVETKFQAVNCEEGTSSEITVYKLPDDSVKINITVTTIEPEDLDELPHSSGFVETSKSDDSDVGYSKKPKQYLEEIPSVSGEALYDSAVVATELAEDQNDEVLRKEAIVKKVDDAQEEPHLDESPGPTIHQRLTRQGIITTVVHPKTPGSGRKKSVSFCPSVGDKGLERQIGDSPSGKGKGSGKKQEVPDDAVPCIDISDDSSVDRINSRSAGNHEQEEITVIKSKQDGHDMMEFEAKLQEDEDEKDEKDKTEMDIIKYNMKEEHIVSKLASVPSRPKHLTGVWRQRKKKGLIRKVHTPSNSAVYVIKTGETPPHYAEMLQNPDRKVPVYQSGLPSISELTSAEGEELELAESEVGHPEWAAENEKKLPQKKRAAARVINVQLDHSTIAGKPSVITLPYSNQSYEDEATGETKVIHFPSVREKKFPRGSNLSANGISEDGGEVTDGSVVSPGMLKSLVKLATKNMGITENKGRTTKRKYKREFIVDCLLCKVKVKDYGYLFRHVKHVHRDHPEVASYLEEIRPLMRTPCPICGKLVSSISNINSHIKQCHAGRDSAVKCPICSKTYKTTVSLRQHMRQCHQPQQKRYCCDQCPAKFTERRSLQEHVNCTHETTEVFSCDDCGKTFLARGRLRRHRYIHGDYRHKCSYCGKGFHLKDNMNKHIEIVHEKRQGKRFACEHCGKRFSVKGNMTQHVLGVHLKQFQFECPNCKRGFRRKNELVAHIARMSCEGKLSIMNAKGEVELVDQEEHEEEMENQKDIELEIDHNQDQEHEEEEADQ